MSAGGRRPGAGRPKGARNRSQVAAPVKGAVSAPVLAQGAPEAVYANAEEFLVAVVQGLVVADPVRVQAAKTLISFQKRRQRVPLAALRRPLAQERADALGDEEQAREEWKRRSEEVRARHARGKN